MITLYRARLETRNFEFEAFGTSREQAMGSLIAGLVKHGKQYDLPAHWYDEPLQASIEFSEIGTGLAYRDRQPLLTKREAV